MFKESTTQLMRHEQIIHNQDEAKGIENTLAQPPHVLQGVDVGALRKQYHGLKKMLDTQSPTVYAGKTKDDAVERRDYLQGQILRGMPTHEEMRKNPPGAVGKHQKWEKSQKKNILEWKNIQLRLNVGNSDKDIANVETFRPAGGSMNMHNAQIPGTEYHMQDIPRSVVITSEEQQQLEMLDPELAGQLSLLSAEKRAQLKDILKETFNVNSVNTGLKTVNCGHEGCKRTTKLFEIEPWHCFQHIPKDE